MARALERTRAGYVPSRRARRYAAIVARAWTGFWAGWRGRKNAGTRHSPTSTVATRYTPRNDWPMKCRPCERVAAAWAADRCSWAAVAPFCNASVGPTVEAWLL